MKFIKCKINKGTQGSIFPKKNNFRRSTVHVGKNRKYVPFHQNADENPVK